MPTSAPALSPLAPASCLLTLLCTLCVGVLGAPQPGQLRVPRVYNALVTSGDELAPSRAYPVLQPLPVLHDTPFGYSVHGLPSYAPLNLQERPNFEFRPTDNSEEKTTTQQQTKTPEESEATQAIAETADIDKKADATTTPKSSTQKPPRNPEEDNPVKLNEFGLPQSLIPIQNFNNERARFPIYDPFNPYHPYFPQVYNDAPLNPYNPYVPSYHQVQFNSYPYNPYGFQPPFYNIPQETPQQNAYGPPQHNAYGPPQHNAYGPPPQNPLEPQISNQAQSAANSESKTKNDSNSPPPPPAPEDLDIKNYKKEDPVIGDVPPPPLPKGGLKN